ncbi:uncharacterized protein LOC100378007 [Saccoglossus kowalevskii]|uniref:Transcriptional regulator ATRX homolog n=1 Tax=Saccoglossus kowalevskii TaxID=10224 RepID=A0ABM0LZV6_SACKO|nr:PREDICTED: transcriptional regulator ATRX homolog [Saccoglossus kowalevskii]
MTKHKKKSKREESSDSGSDYSSASDSDSDTEALSAKKVKLDASAKKKKKVEEKKKKKKEKMKAEGKINIDDFYSKGLEFRLWVTEEKKKYVDELETSKAKVLFKKFVKKWNKGRLPKKYYEGLDASDVAASSRTKYRWKFSDTEQSKIRTVRGRIKSWTSGSNVSMHDNDGFSTFGKSSSSSDDQFNKRPALSTGTFVKPMQGPSVPSSQSKPVQGPMLPPTALKPVQGPALPSDYKPIVGPVLPPSKSQYEIEAEREASRKMLQKERKQFKDHDKMVMDELAPKATGYEAKVEKRIARSYERKSREHSPEMKESYIIGGDDNFQAKLQKRKRQMEEKRLIRQQADSEKVTEYRAKEKAKMESLLQLAKANRSENSLWKP